MKLVVGWTLVGGFVFTVFVTCLSLVGWIKFADPQQQKKLFQILIVELVIGLGAKFLGGVTFDPKTVSAEIERKGSNAAIETTIVDLIDAGARGDTSVDKAQLERLHERIQVEPGEPDAQRTGELRQVIQRLPEGRVSTAAAKEMSTSDTLKRSRALDFKRPIPIAPHN